MPERHEFEMSLEQLPVYDLDVTDTAAVRAWRLRAIEDRVALAGNLPLRMVHVGQGFQRVGQLQMRFEADVELEHAALFMVAARQDGVVRSYREGEITVEEEDGGKYRAAVTLEYHHDTGRWWTARRRFGTNAVSVGAFFGDWVQEEGEGLDALDEQLREWVDASKIEIDSSGHQITPKQDLPEILGGFYTLTRQPPQDARVYSEIVGNLVDKQLKDEYPTGLSIFAFRGVEVEHFIINGKFSFPLDDLVRTIAARGPAEAVAVRHPGVVQIGNESFRSVVTAVECAGRRHDRIVALKFGPDGKPQSQRVFHEDRGAVGPEGCWLGVEPKNAQLSFFLLGPNGNAAPEA